jgi:antitoxin Phd
MINGTLIAVWIIGIFFLSVILLLGYIYPRMEKNMIVNTQKMVSMTEANQNFSKVAKIANAEGSALVMRNNKPEYILLKINNNQNYEQADDAELETVSKKLIQQNMEAYKKLAE